MKSTYFSIYKLFAKLELAMILSEKEQGGVHYGG
jgi:hypothetical protein